MTMDNFENRLFRLEKKFNQLSKMVMESKKFEKWMFYSVAFFYGYIFFHICLWIGRTVL